MDAPSDEGKKALVTVTFEADGTTAVFKDAKEARAWHCFISLVNGDLTRTPEILWHQCIPTRYVNDSGIGMQSTKLESSMHRTEFTHSMNFLRFLLTKRYKNFKLELRTSDYEYTLQSAPF